MDSLCVFRAFAPCDDAGYTIGIWHTHYAIRSAESVVLRESVGELASIFENFVSSFGSPVFLAIITTVTGLRVTTCFGFLGIIVFVTVPTPIIHIVCRLAGADDTEVLHASFLLLLSGATFAPYFFVYSYVGFALLTLALYCYIRVITGSGTQISRSFIVAFILTTLGSSIHYLPGALLFVAIFLALAGLMTILSKLRLNKLELGYIRPVMLFFVAVAAYFVYCGFSFYDDIRAYLIITLKYFSFEPFVIYTPERLKLLDAITGFVIQVTRLRSLVMLIYLLGLLQAIKRAGEYTCQSAQHHWCRSRVASQ